MFCLAAVLLLVPSLAEVATCDADGSCDVKRTKRDSGVVLLQGVKKHGKTQGGELQLDEQCAAEGEDPYDPQYSSAAKFPRDCCAGTRRCGPFYQASWGGWSYECRADCSRRTEPDDCGCVPPKGWSSTRQRCSGSSSTSDQEAQECRDRTSTTGVTESTTTESTTTTSTESTTTGPTTSFTGGTGPTPTHLNIMSWNVFFGNSRFNAMSDMLKGHEIDIANLQETNNKLNDIAEASGYTSINTWRQKHDWCGYNFHNSDWGHAWSKELTVPGNRGVCGAMIFKGNAKLCVWGLHPIQQGNNVKFAKESVRIAAEEMKVCSETYNAPSIFLGDFNTLDWRGVRRELNERTGWEWDLAAKHDIDFIFIQTGPLKVGEVESSEIVGDGTCWPGFPPHNGISRQCGYADHSPLWARIKLDC